MYENVVTNQILFNVDVNVAKVADAKLMRVHGHQYCKKQSLVKVQRGDCAASCLPAGSFLFYKNLYPQGF